jgi:8-oxo-dGTP pyrophosphatase MutT (NUDIX family)/2'-5' RNA ligase
VVDLETLRRQALADGCEVVVGALILNATGHVFSHRRGYDRMLLPGCWDIVGGHVEEDETLLEALRREVAEETGWTVLGEPELLYVSQWQLNAPTPRREFDFLVSVAGDLRRPRLERPKQVEYRWIGTDDLDVFAENRPSGQELVRHVVELALTAAGTSALRSPHAIVFVGLTDDLERLRAVWDPVMAGQIAAHVTVAYPEEIPTLDELTARAAAAARATAPFRLRLDGIRRFESPDDGVYVAIDDVDGAWQALRGAVLDGRRALPVEPHLTIVHPRTSGLAAPAWEQLKELSVEREVEVTELAVTALDGRVWRTAGLHPLDGS